MPAGPHAAAVAVEWTVV